MNPTVQEDVTLQVSGMSCQGCVGKVTRALESVDGVQAAAVDLDEACATIALARQLDTQELVRAVEEAGFTATFNDAPTVAHSEPVHEVSDEPQSDREHIAHARFGVRGMTCANCARTVENALRATSGVLDANVNITGERAEVRFDPNHVDMSTLFGAVKGAGYTAVEDRDTAELDSEEARKALGWLLFSGAAALAFIPLHRAGLLPPVAQMAAAVVVLATAGATFYRGAYHAAKNRTSNMDTLVSLGLTAATGYSAAAVMFPALLAGEHLFFHTAIELVAFIRFGKYLEARVKAKANDTLRGLLQSETDRATRIVDGAEHPVLASELAPDDVIRVRPGERIPVDGVIQDGASDIDEAVITGEPLPIPREVGDAVIGGSISQTGVLEIRVTHVGRDSVFGRIVSLVEDAQNDKAPIERFADRAASVFVPAVIALATATFFGHLMVGHGGVVALSATIAVLVVACPCALGLATPTAIVVGSGMALRRNILIKRASVLEQLAHVDSVVFDKTGTLTTGNPEVVDIMPVSARATADDVLKVCAPLEAASLHPLAQAVCRETAKRGLSLEPASRIQEHAGRGMSGKLGDATVHVGNLRILEDAGLDKTAAAKAAGALQGQTSSVLYVTRDGELFGIIAVSDAVAPTANNAIKALRSDGASTVMLTGDVHSTAKHVAETLGIAEVRAELLPADKIATIREYQDQGRRVAMVGDGINDAPALAQADVGIAIGAGTDVAKETGDVVLINSDVMDVARALRLGKATLRKIKQNLGWALIYNVAALPLAAFGVLPPAWAGLAMALSSVSVVTNSLLLRTTARLD